METIWKFELQTTDEQVISIPEKYQLLCVQTQFGKPYLWAKVEPVGQKGIKRK